jgi:hypothetical protein
LRDATQGDTGPPRQTLVVDRLAISQEPVQLHSDPLLGAITFGHGAGNLAGQCVEFVL